MRSAAATSGRRSSRSEGSPGGNHGRLQVQGFLRRGEFGRRPTRQNGQRVLELRSLHAESRVVSLRRIQQRFRLGDIQAADDTAGVPHVGQVERLLLQVDVVPQNRALPIDVMQHHVVFRDVALEREQHIFVVRHADLRERIPGLDGAANLPPQIHLVARVDRQADGVGRKRRVRAARRNRTRPGRPRAIHGRIGTDRRKEIRSRRLRAGAGLQHSLHRGLQVLVRGNGLGFEIVQLRIAKDLPPVSLADLVARGRALPSLRRRFLPRDRRLGGRPACSWGRPIGSRRAG